MHSEDEKHMHTHSWKEIIKPKKFGGLSLRDLKEMNIVCIAKLGWKIKSGQISMWCYGMHGKYERKTINDVEKNAKVYDSKLWKKIVSLWPLLDKMSK